MDSSTFFTLAIGGIVIFVWGYDRIKRLFQHGTPEASATPDAIAEAAKDATPEQPIGARAWLDYVNAQPDRVPHLAVIGPSGSGKTTLATAVLHDRRGQVVVLTAKEGDHWGGLPYVGIDEDATYTTANTMFAALDAEIKRRLVETKRQRMTSDWLTIVVDDFSTLKNECALAPDVVKLVARLGRSLRVRLVMLSDSALVKAIGLEGEGETRSNFAFIRLSRGHTGALEIDGADVPIDTKPVAQVAQRARLAARAWTPARADDVLAGLLDTGIGGENAANDTGIRYQYQGGIPDTGAVSTGITPDTMITARDRAIMAILDTNPSASKNEIFGAVGGNRNHVFTRIDELRDLSQ